MLEAQPQFADKCDWKKLNGLDLEELLSEHPEFKEKYKEFCGD